MEIITREYRVYEYAELSDEAKEKVREWYLDDDFRPQIFSEDVNYWLSENFKYSDLKVQYSLNYCQGDGLNIYGKVWLSDVIGKIDFSNFTEKEKRFIQWAVGKFDSKVTLPTNNHYCYCIVDSACFVENLRDELEYSGMRDINETALEKFDEACVDYFVELCENFERNGYKYFYEPDEAEIEDFCAANEYRFYESGKVFY